METKELVVKMTGLKVGDSLLVFNWSSSGKIFEGYLKRGAVKIVSIQNKDYWAQGSSGEKYKLNFVEDKLFKIERYED